MATSPGIPLGRRTHRPPRNAGYAATKWGINGWSESLRQELQPDPARYVIAAGAAATELDRPHHARGDQAGDRAVLRGHRDHRRRHRPDHRLRGTRPTGTRHRLVHEPGDRCDGCTGRPRPVDLLGSRSGWVIVSLARSTASCRRPCSSGSCPSSRPAPSRASGAHARRRRRPCALRVRPHRPWMLGALAASGELQPGRSSRRRLPMMAVAPYRERTRPASASPPSRSAARRAGRDGPEPHLRGRRRVLRRARRDGDLPRPWSCREPGRSAVGQPGRQSMSDHIRAQGRRFDATASRKADIRRSRRSPAARCRGRHRCPIRSGP